MDYTKPADKAVVEKTIAAFGPRGFEGEYLETKEAALARIKELIPAGAQVMTGSSTTLNEIGFTDYLKAGQHGWKNLKEDIANEKDSVKQMALRKQSVLSEYWLGSVHAVTENGELLTASNTGSQLPSYAYTSPNVIWVVGTNKIVPNMDEAMKRLHEYVFPLEDARLKSLTAGKSGSAISKILLHYREPSYTQRKLKILFVNEKLGY